jgi:predicted transcriptional regulator of viral defense system
MERHESGPSWDRLFGTAVGQEGYFTTRQAAEAGYSSQLLRQYMHYGKIHRARRGVYRIVHFPAGEHEDLVQIWLWSEQAGIFSHETALALRDLSDVLPARVHLTLPASWRSRRLRTPAGVVLHYGDIGADERTWVGAVPVTSAVRTIVDCVVDGFAPDLLRQAVEQALARGLVSRSELDKAGRAVRSLATDHISRNLDALSDTSWQN